MKILFAVQDEQISNKIVKEYQKKYKEIISYKNIYYFNAILKELQRDKTYDRIIIDEELEEFNSNNYEQKDKFIFEKLDNVSDEAIDSKGQDIPIILICSERRTKSEEIFVKLFGIGIYNAIIGNDRSTEEVCNLIERPRSKKQAKIYYKIDSEEVQYKHENEDDVSEEEMQNILMHFRRIGNNEEKYVESFSRIVKQYNQEQLKIIIKILPINVRAVLEEKSPEYQRIVSVNSNMKVNLERKQQEKGTVEKLLGSNNNKSKIKEPVVVPSTMKKNNVKTLSVKEPVKQYYIEDLDDSEEEIEDFEELEETILIDEIPEIEEITEVEEIPEINVQKPKKRGRPKKNPDQQETENKENNQPKKRGRPRKVNIVQENVEDSEDIQSRTIEKTSFEEEYDDEFTELPGFEEDYDDEEITELPGFEEDDEEEITELPGFEEDDEEETTELPGFEEDDEEENDDDFLDVVEEETKRERIEQHKIDKVNNEEDDIYELPRFNDEEYEYEYDYSNFENLLSSDKKVVAFVGTSKNGTSFIVNNIAQVLSNSGIDTAILDTTQNKNSYYIYTKNEEELRKQASRSIINLLQGNANGIRVNQKLSVYTSVPGQDDATQNVGPILDTLVKRHSAVLIDCDYSTPIEYFDKVQEIYLVQSMDVLTIQPLTAFLRELMTKNVLDQSKIRIVLNKVLRLRNVSAKNIIGGMAFYNDPEMAFIKELFDRNTVKNVEIPFDEEVYATYLEGIIDCEISINNYPKNFTTTLKGLANMVYPLLPNSSNKKAEKNKKGYEYSTGFSTSVNNTLNNMKKRY